MRRNSLRTQKAPFVFTQENRELVQQHMNKYPDGRQASAVMPALDIAQRQNGGWISKEAIETIADLLNMPVIKVWEVATFYSQYNLEPVGKYLIQVCRTTSCWLRGSDALLQACKTSANVDVGQPSEDGLFSLMEVECLGACVNAPMVQINDDYYEDLDAEKMTALISDLKTGQDCKVGPQVDRLNSAPITGQTTNLNLASPVGQKARPVSLKVDKATRASIKVDDAHMSGDDLQNSHGRDSRPTRKTQHGTSPQTITTPTTSSGKTKTRTSASSRQAKPRPKTSSAKAKQITSKKPSPVAKPSVGAATQKKD